MVDRSHVGLVDIRSHEGSRQLNDIGCQWTDVSQRNPWPVSHDHIVGSDVVSEDGTVWRWSRARWRPKKIYRSTWVNLCMQLTSLQFDMGDPFHGQLTAVKTRYPLTSITWPYRGLKFGTHQSHLFLKRFTADHIMDFHWIAGSSIFTKYWNRPSKKSKLRF